MSKKVCDICGTEYDDSIGGCPVCGWDQNEELPADIDDLDVDFLDDIQETAPAAAAASKAKIPFDYDAANKRKSAASADDEDDDEEDEEEESGSNVFLIIVLVLLILALLAVSVYIGWTKIIKPRQAGNSDNKPTESVSEMLPPTTESTTVPTTEYVEETEPTIPCTSLSLVGNMEKLTFKGQYWRLMVKKEPEDTTDEVVYTSGNENVVTIDEFGRVTAVGEGETTIVVTCGDKRLETPAVVAFKTETTEAATEPATPVVEAATTPAGDTAATNGGTTAGGTLKLKKSDITIGRLGVYVTLEVEGGIAAEDVKWSTSDSGVASVYNGNVTATGRGICVITASYNGQSAQCIVRCKW